MKLLAEIRARARYVIGPVLGISTIAYISYHGIQGERGLIAYWQLTKQVDQARVNARIIGTRRGAIEKRVHLLLPGSLDPDMLDERVRVMLGYSHPDEKVILLGK